MQNRLRLIHLMTVARLRAAGAVPWLLFAGWVAFAALQEPRLLRGYGIYLIDDAIWTGGLLVLVALLFVERRLPARCAVAANVAALLLVALADLSAGLIADVGYRATAATTRVGLAAGFVFAWAPLAIVLAVAPAPRFSSRALAGAVVAAALVLGSMHSVALRSEVEPRLLVAMGLAVLAAVLWSTRTPEKRRNYL